MKSDDAAARLGAIKEKKGVPDIRTATAKPQPDIIDIRRAAVEVNLKTEILSMFQVRDGPRQLPTLLLYDERGLQLFEKVRLVRLATVCTPRANSFQLTYLEEYYLTNDEIEVLKSFAGDITANIPSGAMVIELGSGSVALSLGRPAPLSFLWRGLTECVPRNLRKVNFLLQAFEDAAKSIDYYALDLSQQELERTLAQLPQYKHVRAHGLLGTYDDGRFWLKDASNASRRKCILSLGSSVGESLGFNSPGPADLTPWQATSIERMLLLSSRRSPMSSGLETPC
jgi:uncharacterized SAM-dependent methyltransferase